VGSAANIPADESESKEIVKRLEYRIGLYEWAVALAILFVVAGLIGEEWNKNPYSLCNTISTELLTAGVCLEFVLHVLIMSTNKRLLATQKLELENLGLTTAKANERALQAQLALEKYKAPRLLNEASFRMALSGVPPQNVDVLVYGYDMEVHGLSTRIVESLMREGWRMVEYQMLAGAASGILVRTKSGAAKDVENASEKIVEALKSQGLLAKNWLPFSDDDKIVPSSTLTPQVGLVRPKMAEIRIIVGQSPLSSFCGRPFLPRRHPVRQLAADQLLHRRKGCLAVIGARFELAFPSLRRGDFSAILRAVLAGKMGRIDRLPAGNRNDTSI
jgi:hypothetical protein